MYWTCKICNYEIQIGENAIHHLVSKHIETVLLEIIYKSPELTAMFQKYIDYHADTNTKV